MLLNDKFFWRKKRWYFFILLVKFRLTGTENKSVRAVKPSLTVNDDNVRSNLQQLTAPFAFLFFAFQLAFLQLLLQNVQKNNLPFWNLNNWQSSTNKKKHKSTKKNKVILSLYESLFFFRFFKPSLSKKLKSA